MDKDNRLSRADLDIIVAGMTARDLFAAMPAGQAEVKGADVAGEAFESAASRQGYGEGALDRVTPGDAVYLAGLLSETLQVGGPKAESGAPSPDSADIGD